MFLFFTLCIFFSKFYNPVFGPSVEHFFTVQSGLFALSPPTLADTQCVSPTLQPVFLFKSYSWPNQIWSWGDGWLHFRETTPLRDPGSPRITNGFLIIFHHPILCLSLILPMIPETSRELHLNLGDQSQLRSSLSHTCLTAFNTRCAHKAYGRNNRNHQQRHQHHQQLTLSFPERPRRYAIAASTLVFPHNAELLLENFFRSAPGLLKSFSHVHASVSLLGATCRWWNLSSLKSWWAVPCSHGCNFHTWLPEDFPGYTFNRFQLKCNRPM